MIIRLNAQHSTLNTQRSTLNAFAALLLTLAGPAAAQVEQVTIKVEEARCFS
jgi:hypothetical protein